MENLKTSKLSERKSEIFEISDKRQEKYLYIYGIILLKDLNPQMKKEVFEFNFNGLREKPIIIIPYKDLGVLISKYPFLNPILKEKEAMEHADILKKIAKKTTIIPMAFGNVFKDKKILELILKKSYNAVKESLKQIKNKIELGVKVIKSNEDNTMIDEDKIKIEILNSLGNLSVKSVQGENFSERLLLNHSFLVEKNNFSKFSDVIAKLEKKYPKFKFNYTGPWPPYSFVDIHIRGPK